MKEKTKKKIKFYACIYSMLFIALLHFIVFYLVLNFNSIRMAFIDNETNGFTMDNFKWFFEDITSPTSSFLSYFKNTLKYYLTGIFVVLPFSYFCSYFLFKKIPLYKFYKVVFVLPMIISGVVYFGVYKELMGPFGIIAELSNKVFHKTFPNFLLDYEFQSNAIVGYTVWTGLGLNMIMLIGALLRIPEEVFEAARLDGVGYFGEMLRIALPLTWPTFSMLLMLKMVGIFTASGPIILVNEYPSRHVWTISYWLYNEVIVSADGNFNHASAYGIVFTLASLPLFFLAQWMMRVVPDVEF